MLAFLNLGLTEMVLIAVVAILVFGRNLPSVAVQAASTVQRMRRSLTDLRRETGIDEELRRARREFEQAVPRDLPRLVERPLDSIRARPAESADQQPPSGSAGSAGVPEVDRATEPADAASREQGGGHESGADEGERS